jgi:hypothetical protein
VAVAMQDFPAEFRLGQVHSQPYFFDPLVHRNIDLGIFPPLPLHTPNVSQKLSLLQACRYLWGATTHSHGVHSTYRQVPKRIL